ncbi:Sodium/potassium/calcium exchanger 2 [Hondaea fermentalgiana]|uniref:Sodium/potassium/calcium exchanger 2 n=1 Tax=Hondaea fermentalgiana TaxID=2315210 RepID=A0A2R5GJK9_9STRA|nr:Sodium/potassium/calcium exchanger 2 [Hondaea fermentalgiana]|eukprot:GBG31067.1 Sodium/potassium/calcium exchanger 2 [Hondaea fermentalgiana]
MNNRRQLSGGSGGTSEAFCVEDPGMAAFCIENGTNLCTPDEYLGRVCCRSDEECRTDDGAVCPSSHLCSAELVPGGHGYGACMDSWEVNGGAWAYIAIMLFLFLGLAIVCDDYLVSALERISEALNLSEDVAGATFLAAGSSAPELFVSLADNVISNPPKSVGVGTVVGSAIFNILVIIGLSAMLAGSTLHLDWRPLARDVTFYVVSIVALLGVIIDEEAHWWEGLILLFLYSLYIGFMTVNARAFAWMDRVFGSKAPDATVLDGDKTTAPKAGNADLETGPDVDDADAPTGELALMDVDLSNANATVDETSASQPASTPTATMPKTADGIVRAAETVLGNDKTVTKAPAVRHTVETSRPTAAVEAAAEAARMERRNSETQVHVRASLGSVHADGAAGAGAGDGSARFVAGSASANPLLMSRNRGFNHSMRFSREGSMRGGVTPHGGHHDRAGSSRKSLKDVAQAVIRANLESKSWADASQQAVEQQRGKTSEGGTSSAAPLVEGGQPSVNVVPDHAGLGDVDLSKKNVNTGDEGEQDDEEEEQESYWDPLMWPTVERDAETDLDDYPKDGCTRRHCGGWKHMWAARLYYVLSFPFNLVFRLTIPDSNFDVFCEDKPGKPENRRLGYWLSFAISIVWIAVLSHFIVWSASKFGCIVGISSPVMGLTFIAAGTSVPDAISSIIVARQGQGDMAVANSIGSNIFDILIGLGLPWLLAGAIYGRPSSVDTGDIAIGMSFLFAVIVVLIIVLRIARWRLSKIVGSILLFLYILYVIFELAIHPLI